MVRALTYKRPVFEAIVRLCSPGDVEPHLRIDDRGVWIGESKGQLEWTPLCELVEPGSPDPLCEPALPFPFSAAQLAAFMLHGWGLFLRITCGEWTDGPNEDVFLELGVREGKVREVLVEAYRVFRHAESIVGRLDASPQEDVHRLAVQCRAAKVEAYRREGLPSLDPRSVDYRLRIGRVPYLDRLQRLQGRGFALWDVCAAASRPGSLDASIHVDTVIANNFNDFFSEHKGLELVCFNGATAETLYRRHVLPNLPELFGIAYVRLPSTSPAHAAMSFAEKLDKWSVVVAA